MDSTKSGYVTTNTINGVAQIEFFHPAHNSLPSNLLRQLTDAIQVAGQNDAIKVVAL